MKPRFYSQLRWTIIAGMAMGLAGCAHFEHQTSELEPHGLVAIVKASDSVGEVGVVKKLDNLAVRVGHTYRVKPGEHTVRVQWVETMIATLRPVTVLGTLKEQPVDVHVSESGTTTVTRQQPFSGTQPVNLSVESRRITYITNSISVRAGWLYKLDGDRVTTKQFNPP